MSDPDEPQSFQEAWWDPDLIAREKWREAIHLEFKKMLEMCVWRHVKRDKRDLAASNISHNFEYPMASN